MKFQFIEDHREEFEITVMCRVLGVSRSGYYAWRKRPVSPRKMANDKLLGQIKEVYQKSRQTYGSPRIHAELVGQGIKCGRNRVARLMRLHNVRAKQKRTFKVKTTDSNHNHPVAPNRLEQDFQAQHPDQKWLADITYVPTAEGWLYLAVVLDLPKVAPDCGLGHERQPGAATGHRRLADGPAGSSAWTRSDPSLRPRQPVRQPGVSNLVDQSSASV
jgi:hypothetical protein